MIMRVYKGYFVALWGCSHVFASSGGMRLGTYARFFFAVWRKGYTWYPFLDYLHPRFWDKISWK